MIYRQLTQQQRYQIHACQGAGWRQTRIANEIGSHPSTISRELRRNRGQRGYRPQQADLMAQRRRQQKRKDRLTAADWLTMTALLEKEWSPEQISGSLKAGDQLRVSHEWIYRTLEPETFRSLLLLLYGTGLRLGEALFLTLGDVELTEAVMTVRETKFHKTRLVPLGPELHQALVQYATWRKAQDQAQDSDAPFFAGRRGERLLIGSVEEALRCLRTHVGVCRAGSARNQPRLHDLRHCFAVHRLTSWYQEGADVQRLLPKLATYLGHVEISSTQGYLTMTPELLQAACVRFERYALKEESHD